SLFFIYKRVAFSFEQHPHNPILEAKNVKSGGELMHFTLGTFSQTLLQQVVNLTPEQQYEVLKLQQVLTHDHIWYSLHSTELRCFSYIFFLLCDLILDWFPSSSIQGTSNWVGQFHLTETCSNEHGFSHSNYQKKKKALSQGIEIDRVFFWSSGIHGWSLSASRII
ncbi:hypothetical protein HID58_045497, partial [Brassica napus]